MRSAKHVFTAYMQGLEMTHLSVAVSHFLNCLLCSAVQVRGLLNLALRGEVDPKGRVEDPCSSKK
jgi:hypothetical protein